MPILDLIDKWLGRLNDLFISFFAVIVGLIAILLPLNLVMTRLGMGGVFWWLHEGVEYALYVGVFLAAPWVLRRGAHIKADVISAHLPRRASILLDRIVNLLGVVICLTLFVYACRATIWEFQDQTYPPKDLRIANWYMMAIFAVCFFLCTIEFLLSLRRTPADPNDAETIINQAGA